MLKSFIVGSSFLATGISFSYIARGFMSAGNPSDVPYQYIPIVIPTLFGIMNILLVSTGNSLAMALILGALTGLILSLMGRSMDLPRKMFGFTKENTWMVHPVAMILYAGIFSIIIRRLNMMV